MGYDDSTTNITNGRKNFAMVRTITGQISSVDILAIGVHPDDVEIGCIGTLLKHRKKGYSFGIVDLTEGELGTRGNAPLRLEESKKSAEFTGALFRVNFGWPDGFFEHSNENIIELVKIIRLTKPSYILCNAPNDRHPDHGRASKIVHDASFYSGLIKIKTVFEDNELPAHRPKAVLSYIQDYYMHPDLVIDISDCIDEKMQAIQCFASQFYNPHKPSDEPETPISSPDFLEMIKARARQYGRPAGYSFAEGFVIPRYFGIKSLFDLD
jgi:bacillithiol biosynthesis deacetylase BshB1